MGCTSVQSPSNQVQKIRHDTPGPGEIPASPNSLPVSSSNEAAPSVKPETDLQGCSNSNNDAKNIGAVPSLSSDIHAEENVEGNQAGRTGASDHQESAKASLASQSSPQEKQSSQNGATNDLNLDTTVRLQLKSMLQGLSGVPLMMSLHSLGDHALKDAVVNCPDQPGTVLLRLGFRKNSEGYIGQIVFLYQSTAQYPELWSRFPAQYAGPYSGENHHLDLNLHHHQQQQQQQQQQQNHHMQAQHDLVDAQHLLHKPANHQHSDEIIEKQSPEQGSQGSELLQLQPFEPNQMAKDLGLQVTPSASAVAHDNHVAEKIAKTAPMKKKKAVAEVERWHGTRSVKVVYQMHKHGRG